MPKERLKISNYLTKKWPAKLVRFPREILKGKNGWNQLISPETEKYKRGGLQVSSLYNVASFVRYIQNMELFFWSTAGWALFVLSSGVGGSALSCPVGWHSALGRLHRHSFQPAALRDSYKNQWCRTGSLPEYQKSFHLMSMKKCQDEEDGNGGAWKRKH